MRNQDEVKRYYEEFYAQAPESRKAPDYKRLSSNLRYCPIERGDRILDIGCGTGGTLSYLSNLGAEPFGIDISLQALTDAKELFPSINTVQANAEHLPFHSDSMAGVLFMGTLEHFLDPERALSEAVRLSKHQAFFCIVVPNSRFFFFKWLGGTEQEQEEPRTLEEWTEILEKQGLTVLRVHRDIGPSLGTGRLARALMRKLVLALDSLLPLRYTYQFVFVCRKD